MSKSCEHTCLRAAILKCRAIRDASKVQLRASSARPLCCAQEGVGRIHVGPDWGSYMFTCSTAWSSCSLRSLCTLHPSLPSCQPGIGRQFALPWIRHAQAAHSPLVDSTLTAHTHRAQGTEYSLRAFPFLQQHRCLCSPAEAKGLG